MSSAIIIDVETASLYGDVIEVAYGEVAGFQLGQVWTQRFKPAGEFDARAVAIHRLLPGDVAQCSPSPMALANIPVVDYWIGHNIVYDWERLGRPNVKLICTLRLAELVWPKLNTYKLSVLYLQLFGMNKQTIADLKELHTGSCDVMLTAKVLFELMKQTGVENVSQFPFLSPPETWKNG